MSGPHNGHWSLVTIEHSVTRALLGSMITNTSRYPPLPGPKCPRCVEAEPKIRHRHNPQPSDRSFDTSISISKLLRKMFVSIVPFLAQR